MSNERREATVLGVQIGTCGDWDQMDLLDIVYYDFEPLEGSDLPAGTLGVNYDTGMFYQHDDDGNKIFERKILQVMRDVT